MEKKSEIASLKRKIDQSDKIHAYKTRKLRRTLCQTLRENHPSVYVILVSGSPNYMRNQLY